MDNKEKIALLEEMLEVDTGTLKENTILKDIEEWNSMAALSLIILMDENFSKKLSGTQIKEFRTIKNIIDFME